MGKIYEMHFSVSTVNFCIFLIFNQFKHLKSSKKYKTHATNSKIHGACYAIVKTDQVKNSSRKYIPLSFTKSSVA